MPSHITQSEVVHFVLGIPPSTNPYHATAQLISDMSKPIALPRWSQYVEHFFGLVFLMDLFFAGYIIYLRLKTKNLYIVRFNALGLIQLDRGFHCTSIYFIHCAVAVLDWIFKDFVLVGHSDQTWSNLIIGLKSTLLLCNSWAFLWMCVCHCALVKWGPIGNADQTSYKIPYKMAWVLNAYFLLILISTIVSILWAFSHLTIEVLFVKHLAKHVIHRLLHAARKYSASTYQPLKILTMLTVLKPALAHVPRIVYYTRLGSIFYLVNRVILIVTYIPFLAIIMRDFRNRSGRGILHRKQEQILMQGILHTAMAFITFAIIVYLLHFPGDTFIHDTAYWIVLRVGLHGSMAIAESLALYLLWCSMQSPDVLPTKSLVVVFKETQQKEEMV
ncbi:hypothetical protein DFH28DRAFT_951476 [Melampsora americana]|nr:hypothetical protein DFH28DRAFT_951476 [Melampsora americana]